MAPLFSKSGFLGKFFLKHFMNNDFQWYKDSVKVDSFEINRTDKGTW